MLNLPNEHRLATHPFSEAGGFPANEHFVQFYESDFFLADSVTRISGRRPAGRRNLHCDRHQGAS